MTSDQIFDLVDRLALTPKVTEKIKLLQAHSASLLLPNLLLITYDPNRTYGVSANVVMKLNPGPWNEEENGHKHVHQFGETTSTLLQGLRSRTLSGHQALAAIQHELARLTRESGELLRRIIAKDLRAGINATTINKVWKNLIPEYPYQRCTTLSKARIDQFHWDRGVFSQVKADAMFVNVNHELSGEVTFSSRQGKEFRMEAYPTLVQGVQTYLRRGTQSHGEIMVLKGGQALPRKDSNGVINHLNDGGTLPPDLEVRIVLWDQVPLTAVTPGNTYGIGYETRFADLKAQLPLGDTSQAPIAVIETRIVRSLAEAIAHAVEVQAAGGEGTVFKDALAHWVDGTSPWQIKVKLEVDVELRITGLSPGTGKFAATFGALEVESQDGLLQTRAAGLTDAVRKTIFEAWPADKGAIATVRANDLSEIPGQPAALMHGRFVEIRRDKVVADTLEEIRAQFASAKNGGCSGKE